MILLSILETLSDLFILLIFMNGILKIKKHQISPILFFTTYILVEAGLFLFQSMLEQYTYRNSILHDLAIVLSCIVFTFVVTFLYSSGLRQKIFATLLFQVFGMVSEYIFTIIVMQFYPVIMSTENPFAISLINLGCKLVLFVIAISFLILWNHNSTSENIPYSILILSTPLLSIIIILNMPFYETMKDNNHIPILLTIIGFMLLNFANYFLLRRSQQTYELKQKTERMQQQITFQQEKYAQLSAAYKCSRKIVHDTKKHALAMQEYIKKEEYEMLLDYLSTVIDNLESTYARYNTGNLVIDSFLSNYHALAESLHIPFQANLNVLLDQIPLSDYDLCVVLGNLLDNCINACKITSSGDHYIHVRIDCGSEGKFLITTSNSVPSSNFSKKEEGTSLFHGYGVDNIRHIVEAKHGLYDIATENNTYKVSIVIPVMNRP